MPKVIPQYKEQAKERILGAAQQVFSEKGYHETRMEDIAQKLGVSKRTLYLYYKNKEELYKAMYADTPQAIREMLQACLKNSDFGQACKDFFDATTKGPITGLNFEIIATAARDPALRKIVRELNESEIEVLSQFLQEMKERSTPTSNFNPRQLARSLIALYDGLIANLVIGVKKSEVRQAWLDSIDLMMKNLFVSKPPIAS